MAHKMKINVQPVHNYPFYEIHKENISDISTTSTHATLSAALKVLGGDICFGMEIVPLPFDDTLTA
jgi:hypothetical protein